MQQALDSIGADAALRGQLGEALAKIASHLENTH
jgi:truncated hemoglobin YjbI